MKNRDYPLYDKLPPIDSLKDMVCRKAMERQNDTAFTFSVGKNKIISCTYRKFYDDINGLGTWLYMQKIRNRHIAVIGENSYEWLVSFLAIVNGGNVAVPIDKELCRENIAELLKKADVSVVFVSDVYADLVDGVSGNANVNVTVKKNDVRVIMMSEVAECIEAGKQSLLQGIDEYVKYEINPQDTCCIMFTSGTSGKSKGVMLSHVNIATEINQTCKLFVLEGNTIALLPFHHAFGLVVGVLMVLNYGYTIYINKSLKNIKKDLVAAKPQTMFLVPLFIETFYKQIWDTAKKEGKDKLLRKMMKLSDLLLRVGIDIRRKCFVSVRQAFGGNLQYIISGGAGIDSFYIKEFRSWGVEILNGYGTTECSPCAAVNRNFYHKDGTVGVAIPGSKMKIAEDGEVLISGPHVMKGYFDEPEATAEVLHDGWYATGDLGYLDKDDFLTLTGRKKNLIILGNGENVSPEELEAEFNRDSAVCEVLVYALNDVIIAEIFPCEEYLYDYEYFEALKTKINQRKPMYKRIAKIKLRDVEFEKNTSMKIVRYKNIDKEW